MVITQISIPKPQDKEAFEKFMKEEFIPHVYMGPTRIGQTFEVSLLSKESKGNMFVYYFFHKGDSTKPDLGTVSFEIMDKFRTFNPKCKRIGAFEMISARSHQDAI